MAHGPSTNEGSPRPRFEIADVVRALGRDCRNALTRTPDQHKALRDITACRTATLGGHVDVCSKCGYERPSYNSCRNRHCPKCQGLARAAWVEARVDLLLPVPYFHIVFTLPAELRPLVHANRKQLFDLLFKTASGTILELAPDDRFLGARPGITAVLHTWSRDLGFHPHVHCVVTGGGLEAGDAAWKSARNSRFLFPVHVLSAMFRGKFLARLDALYETARIRAPEFSGLDDPDTFHVLKDRLYRKRWVVYAQKPFAGPRQVFTYLGHYTHRVAIANSRILDITDHGVRFRTRGEKTVTLKPREFVRRFLLHVLPKGFVKIRHYGILAPVHARRKIAQARRFLSTSHQVRPETPDTPSPCSVQPTTMSELTCPRCSSPSFVQLVVPRTRPPPRLGAVPP